MKKVTGISDCQLVDHGDAMLFTIDEDDGGIFQFKIRMETVPIVVQTLVKHWSVGRKMQTMHGAKHQELVDGWMVTSVAGGVTLDQNTIALRLATNHSEMPIVALLPIPLVQETIRCLQTALVRAAERGPRKTN